MVAEIKPEFGYERAWCFRAHTGFTALGLRKRQRGEAGSTPDGIGINGYVKKNRGKKKKRTALTVQRNTNSVRLYSLTAV